MENNDYELVALAQENNEDAINILYQKYKLYLIFLLNIHKRFQNEK